MHLWPPYLFPVPHSRGKSHDQIFSHPPGYHYPDLGNNHFSVFVLFSPESLFLHCYRLKLGYLHVLCCLVTQSCPTLWDPMDYSPPASSVHGDSPARTLVWVAMPFSRESSKPKDQTQVSHIACGFFTSETPGKPGVFACNVHGWE